jgi:hypothetical protein
LIESFDDVSAALAETRASLADERPGTLYEPAFHHEGVVVRGDILVTDGQSTRLVEVKSSTGVKSYHHNDAAIQYWVITGAGLPLKSVSIAHINRDFEYRDGEDYRGLFTTVDVTEEITCLAAAVPRWIEQCNATLAGPMPDMPIGAHCSDPFDCPFWGHCSQGEPDMPVGLLPRAGKLAAQLREEGLRDLREVPCERLSRPIHQRVWRVTMSGQAEIDPMAGECVRALAFPRFYLDFETIQFAVPIWAGTRPYEQLPFQWSCHAEHADGRLGHNEFLDLSGEAPMRRFAETLLAHLGVDGAIVVYGHFEATILRGLAARFPDLGPALERVIDRIHDLLPIVREHYYHPAMRGSWSLKAVLPTIAPDLSYEELGEVQDGGGAQAAYLEAIDQATTADRKDSLARYLSDYCCMDTQALCRIMQFLSQPARSGMCL